MSFPVDLTATLSGTSMHQLRAWKNDGLLVPEIRRGNPSLYSFRDVRALRAIAFLRARVSLQRIKTAFRNMRELNFDDHPSTYTFSTDGKAISLTDAHGEVCELVKFKGQMMAFTLEDAFRPFENLQRQTVPDFERPRRNLEIVEGKLGGWPTVRGTRIPYDLVASFLGTSPNDEAFDDLEYFYPDVSREGGADSLSFHQAVLDWSRRTA